MAKPQPPIARIPDLAEPLPIGNLAARNRVFLAPMSGVSDGAFRKMAWRFGAGMVFSEMVASEALVNDKQEMTIKAQCAGLPIHAVQIAGRQAKWMGLAAKMAQDNGAHLIDINMGCPSRRVTRGLSGSALMRDLDHAMGLIDAVVAAVKVPVTLKMRLGWDDASINAPELAARAQNAGIAMISVHGRTRCQFYNGEADWQAVRMVRNSTQLPLVVNGDIATRKDALEALTQSGADAVMIGRASYGKPWLPGDISRAAPATGKPQQMSEFVLLHLQDTLQLFGQQMGLRHFRKHLGWYLDNVNQEFLPQSLRRQMMTCSEPSILHKMIANVFNQSHEYIAA